MRITLLLIAGLALAAGCQQEAAVSALPPPNFNGPLIESRPEAISRVAVGEPALPPMAAPEVRAVPARPRVTMAGIPRDWIPVVEARPWRWIVIHHSATSFGSAAIIDRWHRDRGFDELGYHFVIGNGTNSGDGQVEVGPRWPVQKHGAHDRTPDNRFNEFGIGICLVGNFDITHPTARQMQSVAKLVAFLMKTYHIPPERVLGHGDTKATECPGRNMSVAEVRVMAGRILAENGVAAPPDNVAEAGGDLMVDSPGK